MADTNLTDDDLGDYESFPLLFRYLKRIILNNTEYFEQYTSKAVYKKFYNAFNSMLLTIDPLEELAVLLAKAAPAYDYSSEVKGNGYRSLLRLVEHCIRSVTELAAYCQSHRDRFYFRSHHYSLEVEAYAAVFQRTYQLLQYAKLVVEDSVPDKLFPESFDSKVMLEVEQLDRECFYGRTLGFQFSTALRRFLHMVCVAMASFAEGYHRHKASSVACATVSLLNSGKYTVNPEMRAKMIVDVTQKTNMDFCKMFWSLTEGYGLQHVPLLLCSAMKVNRVFGIPPIPFELRTVGGGEPVCIAPPCSWSGLAPVQVRLLSYEWREGQNRDGSESHSHYGRRPKPKSKGLLIHIHGGGFVAQSSKSHEMYLRSWAYELGVPILSIDYSLAPEAPFPRALEECFFVYAWALDNLHQLGTTGECICLAGDSAGGNLCVSLSMRAAEFEIRTPDSILAAYSPFNVQWVPSPSRLLSLMDPLLPTGILAGCLAAYSGMGKSPFDDCTKNAIKTLTDKTSHPFNIVSKNRRKTNSLFSRLHIRSNDSKLGRSSSYLYASMSSSFESFHSCLHSPPRVESVTPRDDLNAATLDHDHRSKLLLDQNGLQVQQNGSRNPAKKSSEPAERRSGTEIEHSIESSHYLNAAPSKQSERDDIAVHFHSDKEDCHIVNVMASPKGGGPETSSPPNEQEERGHSTALSMSQVCLPIAKNPYMSPLLASDNMLATLPPVDIVACTLDPILDDSVEFARRLRSLGKDVELYILQDLPHGFLNFHQVSQEAREGCELCIVCLKRNLFGKRKLLNAEKAPVY